MTLLLFGENPTDDPSSSAMMKAGDAARIRSYDATGIRSYAARVATTSTAATSTATGFLDPKRARHYKVGRAQKDAAVQYLPMSDGRAFFEIRPRPR